MSITTKKFGITPAGDKINLYEVDNGNGITAVFTDYGAIMVSLFVPNHNGERKDIVLGYDNVKDYFTNDPHFGSTIGRNGNRIDNAEFEIGGVKYILKKNDGNNNLHSGPEGYDRRLWKGEPIEAENAVKFSLHSPHGDQGFPGNFDVSVTYRLTKANELEIEYDGISDKDTIANMTNHSYYNLSGHDSGSILKHKVWLKASKYTPVRKEGLIPTGELATLSGTPLDFSVMRTIGDEIESDFDQMVYAGGYDHNFALDVAGGKMEKVAVVTDEKETLTMEVYTDCVGIQFYTGNFIKDHTGKNGAEYKKRYGLCLETQFFPNSMNQPEFKSPVLKAGERYHTKTVYKFI